MQNLQHETETEQDTLAVPAFVIIESLRRAIEASGVDIPTERLLTVALHVATVQTARRLRTIEYGSMK